MARADEIPDGNDHLIDPVRYAMTDDVLRGTRRSVCLPFFPMGTLALSFFVLTCVVMRLRG